MSFSWLMKSTPVEYSVKRPTNTPNMTQRPLKISFARVQPNTLHTRQIHFGNGIAGQISGDERQAHKQSQWLEISALKWGAVDCVVEAHLAFSAFFAAFKSLKYCVIALAASLCSLTVIAGFELLLLNQIK